MDRSLDFSTIVFGAAVLNLGLAMYSHYRYVTGPSSSKYLWNAQFHWGASAAFVTAAAITERSLSPAATLVIGVIAVILAAVALTFLHRTRKTRFPSVLDEIATDDIIDGARDRRTHD